jgi:hypothetical protein
MKFHSDASPGKFQRFRLNSDIAFLNEADLFGIQYSRGNKSNFSEVVPKTDRLLISKENGIFAILNFGIEV